MRERTNTRGFGLAAGRYVFQVVGVPEKVQIGNTTKRVWKLAPETESGEVLAEIEYHLVPWEAKDFLLAVGGTPDGEYVDWDDEEVDGKRFKAEVIYVDQVGEKAINPKTGTPYKKMKLIKFEEEIGF